jgi:hypothetical protein
MRIRIEERSRAAEERCTAVRVLHVRFYEGLRQGKILLYEKKLKVIGLVFINDCIVI